MMARRITLLYSTDMKQRLLALLKSKRVVFFLILFVAGVVAYFSFFHTLTVSPVAEARQMQSLAAAKVQYELSPFVSDGCSGNVSAAWTSTITKLSDLSDSFEKKYADTAHIPFEAACIEHDRAYHRGEGGYTARLQADNALRAAIITYGIEHTNEIQSRTGLNSPEEAIFWYELIAEAVYRGVRLGGAPCTGMPYAWGYGYHNGACE